MSYFELQRLKVLQLLIVPVLNKTVINLGKSDKNSILIHTESIYCYGEKRGTFGNDRQYRVKILACSLNYY